MYITILKTFRLLSLACRVHISCKRNVNPRRTAIGSDLKPLLVAVFQYRFNQSRCTDPPSHSMLSCVEYPWISRNLSTGQRIRPPNLIHIDYGVCVSLYLRVPHIQGRSYRPIPSARQRKEEEPTLGAPFSSA